MRRSRRPSVQSQIIHVKPINPVDSDMAEEAIKEPDTGGRAVQFAPGKARPNNPGGAQEIELANQGGARGGGEAVRRRKVSTVERDEPRNQPSSEEQMLQEVLDTRPTLKLGRVLSSRYRGDSAYHHSRSLSRGDVLNKSLSPRRKKSLRRKRRVVEDSGHSSTLPPQGGLSSNEAEVTISMQDVQALEEELGMEEGEVSIRASVRRLKDRIDMHRETMRAKESVVRESCLDNIRDVKWPKWKSRIKVLLSWELWKGHMKEVEGHFGTAVVSYFIFLRFLFLLNIVIFAITFGFMVIPGIIHGIVNDTPRVASRLACVYPPLNSTDQLCPADNVSLFAGTNLALEEGTFYYQLSVEGEYSCNVTDPDASVFLIQSCFFGETLSFNGTDVEYSLAEREGGETINVADVMPDEEMECRFERADASIRRLRVCSSGIAPNTQWYSYIIDFFLGQGVFNDTILFYGRYSNSSVVGDRYSIPLAYLLVTGSVYTISFVLLVYKLGSAYNENYTQISNKNVNFANKLFAAWDFNITNSNTAKLKKVHIKTDFEEEIADYEKRNLVRGKMELAKVIVIRFFTNLFTIVVLAAGSAAIFYAAEFGLRNPSSTLEGLVSPVVISALNLILPFLFSFLAKVERFKTQSGEIKMTLLRTVIVRLSSLIVLMITIFILISCTQEVAEQESSVTATCQFVLSVVTANTTTSAADCPVCWETFIGQEFYKLSLTNFVISSSATIGVETFRNVVSRVKFKGIGEKIGKGNFNIPKSILDLIYTQALLWLGFFFSPFVPVVVMITSFMLFYVKKYSLVINLVPDKRGTFRAARTNFLFILLILVSLFLILLPIGYIIANYNPSETCGPFRGNRFMFTVITDLVDSFNCSAQQALDFFGSVGFIVPFVVFLLLALYGQHVVLRSRTKKFKLVRKQLLLEGANVTHIVGKLDGFLKDAEAERKAAAAAGRVDGLESRIRAARNSDARSSGGELISRNSGARDSGGELVLRNSGVRNSGGELISAEAVL